MTTKWQDCLYAIAAPHHHQCQQPTYAVMMNAHISIKSTTAQTVRKYFTNMYLKGSNRELRIYKEIGR